MADKRGLSIQQIALFGMLGAMTFGAKFVMSYLPNIEPVSLLVMVYTVVLGRKALYPIYLYVMLEILIYGIGTWNFNYLYIWAILWLLAYGLRNMKQPLGWAILSGAFGLFFGMLCAPVDIFIGGISYAVSKWVSGLSFDLLHCGGNFIIALVLFSPLRTLLGKLYKKVS